ncbi:MAG: hypothetical protein LBK53_09210 [Heliobacteriaceae bacterium]|jgi:hypothetical protein|nr:hypothetical protein [Heliobacteriaceae bacterium]
MIETTIRDFLVENHDDLTTENCFVGSIPEDAPASYCVVRQQSSPLSDTHNSISEKLTTPHGINQKVISLGVEVVGEDYETGALLIAEIFMAMGGEDGGCIDLYTTQAYVTPVEPPFYEKDEDLFKFNFIVRTNS